MRRTMVAKAIGAILCACSLEWSASAQTQGELATLEAKAAAYQLQIPNHMQEGQLLTRTVGGGYDDHGDAATYSGYYYAAQAARYRATGSLEAYCNVLQGLQVLHRLQAITGVPGLVARFVDPQGFPIESSGTFSSKDVYTGILLAYAMSIPLLNRGVVTCGGSPADSDAIRAMAVEDVRAIGYHLVDHNGAFEGTILGSPVFVNLRTSFDRSALYAAAERSPESLVAFVEGMQKLRDGLLRVVGESRCYGTGSAELCLPLQVQILFVVTYVSAQPLRCDAASPFYAPDLCVVPGGMTREEVVAAGRLLRSFLDLATATIGQSWSLLSGNDWGPDNTRLRALFDDLFAALLGPRGPTGPPPCIPEICTGFKAQAIASALDRHWNDGFTVYLNLLLRTLQHLPQGAPALIKYLSAQPGADQFLADFLQEQGDGLPALAKRWLQGDFQGFGALQEYVSRLPQQLQRPEDLNVLSSNALLQLHVLGVTAGLTGDPRLLLAYEERSPGLLAVASTWNGAADDILTRTLGDDAADAARMEGTHQLLWTALYDLLSLDQNASRRAQYQGILHPAFGTIRDEWNAFATYVHEAQARPDQKDIWARLRALEALSSFPPHGNQELVYTCDHPAVVHEWGGCIRFLGDPGTRLPIPLDRRPRDQSTWQRSPRRLTNAHPGRIYPGVDYLLAFWLARAEGILANTPTGSNVTVIPVDATRGTTPVRLTFAQVVSTGETRLEVLSGGPTPPEGFGLSTGTRFYELSSTATYSGAVEVCVEYSDADAGGSEEWLRLFHSEGQWVDITTSRNTEANQVCGVTSSLSPFLLARDIQPPQTGVSWTPAANEFGWWNQWVSVELTSRDNYSGVRVLRWLLSGASHEIQASSASLVVNQEGRSTLEYGAEDFAQNVEPRQTRSFPVDVTPPQITATPDAAPNQYSWYRTPVEIRFDCSDALSGILRCPQPVGLTTEGKDVTASGEAEDYASNRASATARVNIDLTDPSVGFTGNQGVYTVDKFLQIRCVATDDLSGILTTTCRDITGPAYEYPLGVNVFSAQATDRAERASSAETSFRVEVTFDSLCALSRRFANGAEGIGHALCSQLNAAKTAITEQARAGALGAYSNHVRSQAGKSLTGKEADILLRLAAVL